MPAMHPTDGIGMNRKRQVLMHSSFSPEDAGRVGIIAYERLYTTNLPHSPLAVTLFSQRHQCRRPAIRAIAGFQTPPAQVMRTGNNARTDTLGYPCPVDIVTNLSRHPQKVSCLDANTFSVTGMNPYGIRVRYFIEPLRVPGARVYQRGQTECGNQQVFSSFMIDSRAMHVAMNIARDGVFRPPPVLHRRGIKFQPARGGRKTLAPFAVDHHAYRCPIPRHLPAAFINARSFQFSSLQLPFIQGEDRRFLLWNFK